MENLSEAVWVILSEYRGAALTIHHTLWSLGASLHLPQVVYQASHLRVIVANIIVTNIIVTNIIVVIVITSITIIVAITIVTITTFIIIWWDIANFSQFTIQDKSSISSSPWHKKTKLRFLFTKSWKGFASKFWHKAGVYVESLKNFIKKRSFVLWYEMKAPQKSRCLAIGVATSSCLIQECVESNIAAAAL